MVKFLVFSHLVTFTPLFCHQNQVSIFLCSSAEKINIAPSASFNQLRNSSALSGKFPDRHIGLFDVLKNGLPVPRLFIAETALMRNISCRELFDEGIAHKQMTVPCYGLHLIPAAQAPKQPTFIIEAFGS